MAVAVLDNVSYLYPGSTTPVLRDVSLEIGPGELLGLIGPTGAGKTTLCLTLNGIVPQFYGGRFFGRATVAGLDTVTHPISTLARHVAAVFQDPETQLIATSVENEIAFSLENLGLPRDEIRRRIPEALAAVRLSGYERKHPHELSGGQKQRLAIAAALATRPSLVVLDEPTSQLDPVGEQEVFSVVRALNREHGLAVLLVSHSAERMAEHADRLVLLSEGRIICSGTPEEIYGQPDLLAAHHLRPPQVAETFHHLRRSAVPVPKVPVLLLQGQAALRSLSERQPLFATPPLPAAPPPPVGPPVLSVRDLCHTYADGTQALRGLTLDIHAGEYVVLLGQNGAGKSTLVRHFLNLLKPTSGSVRVGGREAGDVPVSELAQHIGYVAQNPDRQIFSASVGEEVGFALHNLGYPRGDVETRVSEALEDMGLSWARNAHPLSLSKGDRSRVIIAAILAMRPEIIILDEPTTGQDFRGARRILDLSRRLHRMGKTVIVVTHHLYLMSGVGERALVMGRGTLLCDAPLREAYHETEILHSTFLTPPQAVQLAQTLGELSQRKMPLVTPAEVAACFLPVVAETGHAGRGPMEGAPGWAARPQES